MILQNLGWGCEAVAKSKLIKDLSYNGVSNLDDLSVGEIFFLGNLDKISSDIINLDRFNRFNRVYNNTCFNTASYFFDIFDDNSTRFRRGALLTFEGDVIGVAKDFSEVNFLAFKSFYNKSKNPFKSFYSFPLIKGVAYSVNLFERDVFRREINTKPDGEWGRIELADFKDPIGVVPSRVLLNHELNSNLRLFENYILKEIPSLKSESFSKQSVINSYL